MKSELLPSKLIDLISKKCGLSKNLIKNESDIEEDLGLTGEDAEELIKEISKQFSVDISKFVFSKYFQDEPSILTTYRKVVSLTVGDLVHAVQVGRLE